MWVIDWKPKALKQLIKIKNDTEIDRIRKAVDTLSDLPTAKNVKALTHHQYGYRLKVGNYRVLFDADVAIRIIDIQEVKKRDDNTY
ncbi:MAG: type II toxin-antitoxin system RelE/ParE family toxin [Agitococcus sp.]|jgi:mRNA interferase RelE/StbE|nr:type II toxin-antitoxin system RelE/ParE family toxin [Agitococcus sp.]